MPAGRLVFLAIERHLADLADGQARGLRFDAGAAAHAIEFFESFLRLAEGENAGQPFDLEPWQQFIIGSLFGWKGADGFRRFRTAYIEVGKGNGKSPLAAGIGLYGLVADGEAAAEIYSAAVVKDQAKILFRDAENMRSFSPLLRQKIAAHLNNLSVARSGSYFRPISSEKRGLDGKRVHMALIDEIHEHPSSVVVDKMRAGTKGRRQALIFEITNSGYDRQTVCYQHHEYSQKILDGIIPNDSWFAYICQLDCCEECRRAGREQPSCDDCDSWLDEAVWIKANPNLGISIKPKYLQEQVLEAMGMPAKENIVKRLNFCIWTQAETRAIGAEAWSACSGIAGPVDPVEVRKQWIEELRGRDSFAALDLASTTDIAAEVLYFPKGNGNPLARVLPFFFVPQEAIEERSRKDRVPYDVWARQGFIIPTPGNVIDYDFIREHTRNLARDYRIQEMAFDPWNATQLVTQLQADGMKMVEHRQGYQSMTAPTKELLKMVVAREFGHGHNPVLAWMADNLVVTPDPAGNLKPDRSRVREKIDGMVAFIMAIGRALASPQPAAPSVWSL